MHSLSLHCLHNANKVCQTNRCLQMYGFATGPASSHSLKTLFASSEPAERAAPPSVVTASECHPPASTSAIWTPSRPTTWEQHRLQCGGWQCLRHPGCSGQPHATPSHLRHTCAARFPGRPTACRQLFKFRAHGYIHGNLHALCCAVQDCTLGLMP